MRMKRNFILFDSFHQKWTVLWIPSNLFNILPSSAFLHCAPFYLLLCRCVFKWNYAECTAYGNETDGILNLFSLSILHFHFFSLALLLYSFALSRSTFSCLVFYLSGLLFIFFHSSRSSRKFFALSSFFSFSSVCASYGMRLWIGKLNNGAACFTNKTSNKW